MSKYHSVLPPRESFSDSASGAIAIVIQQFHHHNDQLVIYGGKQTKPTAYKNFIPVTSGFSNLIGLTKSYARKISLVIPDSRSNYIEVHNRPEIFSILRSRHSNSKITLYLHNDPQTIRGLKTKRERQIVLNKCDGIICVSDYLRERFLEDLESVDSTKVHVVFNAILPQTVTHTSKRKRILYVGRMQPNKGVLNLVKALIKLLPKHPDWKVGFIGSSKHGNFSRTTFEKKVMQALDPIKSQVEWHGQLPHSKVCDLYSCSSIVVAPSICNEAFCLVALEAMVHKCAFVGSGTGGMSEVMGDFALYIDPHSPDSIESAVEQLILDGTLRKQISSDGQSYVINMFDLDSQKAKLSEIRRFIMNK